MELLSGETLADRILRGPLAVGQADPAGRRDAHRAAGHSRPGSHSSRPQARQHLPDAARREDPRLRSGQTGVGVVRFLADADRDPAHPGRNHDGHAALHVARADPGTIDRRAHRSVCDGGDAVRDARRQAGVRQGHKSRSAPCHTARGAAGARWVAHDRIGQPNRPAPARQESRRSTGVGIAGRRGAQGLPRARRRRGGLARAHDDVVDRAAVPRAPRRCRDGFPGLQPARRDRQLAGGSALAGRAIDGRSGAVCRRRDRLRAHRRRSRMSIS